MLRNFGRCTALRMIVLQNLPRQRQPARLASSYVTPHVDDHHQAAEHGDHGGHAPYVPSYREKIGQREIVGYGWNGEPDYHDSKSFPYPAIRWEAPNAEVNALRAKEEGDWHNLTIDEKKRLYRASFRETFAEMDAPTGEWKFITGLSLIIISAGLTASILIRQCMPPLPITMDDEHRLAQLKRMIDLRVGHVDGLSSWWDYEKGQWKE